MLVAATAATTTTAGGTLRRSAAFRQFGTGLGIGFQVVGIVTKMADSFTQLVHICIFGVKSDGDFCRLHVVRALFHPGPLRNVLHHDFLALGASAVGLDSNGLCFRLLLCKQCEHHRKKGDKGQDFFHIGLFLMVFSKNRQQKYIICVKWGNVFYEKL